ncbi:Calx-beta domain-containing protein [Tropicimonas marinistellae]|uniref:Calx-beta domain-containing protein n=1 Tax=Tropicimonas marinistellae TaxID=1739787 RepID=UPI000836D706|nr:Calx-beta domain-containing protein [Tropicimonas marinistellae]
MVKMTLSPAYAVEGTNAYTDIVFTATLATTVFYDVTVNYRTLFDGSADETDLYLNSIYAPTGSFTIAAGDTTATITLRTSYYDDVNEYDEFFTLELFNPTSGVTFPGDRPVLRAMGIIQDDDGSPSLSVNVSDPIYVEQDSGTRNAVFEVRLSQPAPKALSFDYTTIDGSALAGSDYTETTGTINFVPGQEVAYVNVPIKGDRLAEGTETFSLKVTPPTGEGISTYDSVGEATILDDDAGKGTVISLHEARAIEGTNNYTDLVFTATLSEAYTQDVMVSYRTLFTGTGAVEDLYSTREHTGTITFVAGETSKDITIQTSYYDSDDEFDEVVFLELFNPSTGAMLAGGVPTLAASGVILDDDGGGTNVALASAPVSIVENEYEDKSTVHSIAVELTRPSTTALSFDVKAVNGTAKAGADFTLLQNSIYFAPGKTTAGVKVRIKDDLKVEALESFELAFTLKSGADFSGSILNQSVTIVDTPVFTAKGDVIRLTAADDRVNGLGGNDEIFGLGGNDLLRGGSGRDLLDGGAGADNLLGGGGDDGLFGGGGNDLLSGDAGGDRLVGGAGVDTASYASAKKGVVASFSKTGKNTRDAQGDSYTGVENMIGSNQADTLEGDGRANKLDGGKGDDLLIGKAGNDVLLGGAGRDKLLGGDKSDRLDGGAGSDILGGGKGADKFVFTGGNDRITDFQNNVDTVLLDSDLWSGRYSVQRLVDRYGVDNGNSVSLEFSGGNSLKFAGVKDLDQLVDDISYI